MSETNFVIPKRLIGKVAVLTASTYGIGFETARRLAQEGAIVIISSRNAANVATAVETLKKEGHDVRGVVCHASNKQHRASLIDKAIEINGKIDILVSNAAVNLIINLVNSLDVSEEEWDKIFDVNVKSAFLLTKEILPYMAKGGSIVYVSSIAGVTIYFPVLTYAISKSALCALSRAVAYQCIPLGIRVNCVSPGAVQSSFSQFFWNNPKYFELAKKAIPMKRFGEPHEIASLIAFLSSDDASYITGENYVIAGGLHSRL
uniref:Dehydrogenase/reductase SDR family member 4 n=1 Tax=Strigamia maritima TaxID=126957 RepID=T1JKP7_STRMM